MSLASYFLIFKSILMKFLIFLIFPVALTTSNLNVVSEIKKEDPKKVFLEYTDKGNEIKTVEFYSLEGFMNADLSKYDDELVFDCTVMFEGGECAVQASTCEAARAGFEACACALGHTHFCNDSLDPNG